MTDKDKNSLLYQKYKKERKRRVIHKRISSVLAIIILVSTVAVLILPAVSQANTTYCGFEEHIHNEECFEKRQICELDENLVTETEPTPPILVEEASAQVVQELDAAPQTTTDAAPQTTTDAVTEPIVLGISHEHTDECYELFLICEKPEHEHTLICMSDTTADLETQEEWTADLMTVELTANPGEDFLAIAKTQIGYTESSKNYSVEEDGVTKHGYNRYGAWYGEPYASWNSIFVSFCAYYARVDTIEKTDDCVNWINILKSKSSDLLHEKEQYIPLNGDIIFMDKDSDAAPDWVGIVAETDQLSNMVKVIEGDNNGKVDETSYSLNDEMILGYITHTKARTSGDEKLVQQEISATVFTDETLTQLSTDEAIIKISGLLPENATATAYPVTLTETVLEGESVVAVYDITIWDSKGNPFSQEKGFRDLIVTINTPEIQPDDNGDFSVYHITDLGESEEMNLVKDNNVVSFYTDHFSVYAITRSGQLAKVYLDGENGDDSADGSENSPVKTFEAAMALLSSDGTIYISGNVTIDSKVTWSMGEGQKIQRDPSYSGALVTVASGGDLTLEYITLNGGSDAPSSSNIATNSTYASGSAKAPLIVVDTGGKLSIHDGTVLEYNSNKPDISNNKFVKSGYVGLGGAVYCSGSLVMTGGRIQYCEAQCGGGVYIEGGDFNMSGGTIDSNYARDIVSYRNRLENYHMNAGGGVYVGDHSSMNLTGGTISNNQSSREGGGISLGWLDRSNGSAIYEYVTTFNMTGGVITGNYATSTGGGLNITAGCEAYISAGEITYNTADGKEYQDSSNYTSAGNYARVYSGGGIYIDAQQWDSRGDSAGVPGKCVINRVIITDNSATYGGGIASCSTSDSSINSNVDLHNGTAIYNNTASSGGNELYLSGSYTVGNTVLGGGSYNWSKNGGSYDNSLTDSSSAIQNAYKLYTVMISNNSAYLGGGIGCNGIILIGGDTEATSISIEKKWVDAPGAPRPESITVQILQNGVPYGDPIVIYRTLGEDGVETWPVIYIDNLPGGYTYTVQEISVSGYATDITENSGHFTITNTATGFIVQKKWVDDSETDRPESITVQLYQNGLPYGEVKTLSAKTGWTYMWFDLPEADANGVPYEYTAREDIVPDGYICTDTGSLNENDIWEIENTKIPVTSVSAEKRWADGLVGTDEITVRLFANGEQYGKPVNLNSENGWFYMWENLPTLTQDGEDIEYTIKEDKVYGYLSEITTSTVGPATVGLTPVTSLTEGNRYVFVSANGALADGSSDKVAWLDVSENIANGTIPDSSAVWTYSSNTFRSGSGQYLTLQYTNRTYTYSTSTSGSSNYPISFSNSRFYYRNGSTYRYFTGINSSGYGTAATTSNSAVTFTAYLISEVTRNIGETHFVVTNTKSVNSITVCFTKYIVKNDINSDFPVLPGAELSLYKESADGALIPGTEVNGILVDQWTSEGALTSNHGAHGVDVTDGTYYLIETKAPAGYNGLSGPVIFQVNVSEEKITVLQYPGYEDIFFAINEDGVISGGDSVNIPVYNSTTYVLPETGGIGTYIFALVGLVLIIVPLVLLMHQGKKRRKGVINLP